MGVVMKKYKVFTRFCGDRASCGNEIPAENQNDCRLKMENMLGLVEWKFHRVGENHILLADGTTEEYEI
jgi:hypothetical protein